MTEMLKAVLIFIAVFMAVKVIYSVIKRLKAVRRLISLNAVKRITAVLSPSAIMPRFRISKGCDATVEIEDEIYLIRFFSGRSSLSFLHFASERFAVVYSKARFTIGSILLRGRGRKGSRGQTASESSRQRVYTIPTLRVPDKYAGKKTREVILLDPEPCEVTYVTEAKNSIRAAYTGDEVYGRMIFTPESFYIYADRRVRSLEYERESGVK